MDENMKWLMEAKVKRTLKGLENNGFEAIYKETAVDLLEFLNQRLPVGCKVSVGGARTLYEAGVLELLRDGKYEFLDRYKEGLTVEQIKEIYRQTFSADYYVMSSNAVTENGWLYNVDGTGNRVAALTYGPDKVIVIVGHNKIVLDEAEAIKRNQMVSGPANAKRLSRKTPCVTTGICSECHSADRICKAYSTMRKNIMDRITVVIVGEAFGY